MVALISRIDVHQSQFGLAESVTRTISEGPATVSNWRSCILVFRRESFPGVLL